jgi:hypothetical protein
LRMLSARLYAMNSLNDSLTVVELAERLLRSIENPTAGASYGLARSLELHAAVLSDLPRRREAARRAEEAVALHRALAAQDPARFGRPLARALDARANRERRAKARQLRAEAAAIRNEVPGREVVASPPR